jgi:ABC-type microcin C transport system permease subunit YejE
MGVRKFIGVIFIIRNNSKKHFNQTMSLMLFINILATSVIGDSVVVDDPCIITKHPSISSGTGLSYQN